MARIFKFKGGYFILSIIILLTEILIALFAHDRFVRPYLGDFLVVILVYCFLRAFINISVTKLAFSALIFSYLVETMQYVDVLHKLGLQNSSLAKTLMGSSFEWSDMLAYTLGIVLVFYAEGLVKRRTPKVENH